MLAESLGKFTLDSFLERYKIENVLFFRQSVQMLREVLVCGGLDLYQAWKVG
jgi:hypothetical protein